MLKISKVQSNLSLFLLGKEYRATRKYFGQTREYHSTIRLPLNAVTLSHFIIEFIIFYNVSTLNVYTQKCTHDKFKRHFDIKKDKP